MAVAEHSPKKDARAGILGAAAREFAESGFAGARVDRIARRAGVNKAMLYYHVGNKSALYEAVLLGWMDLLLAELGRRVPESGDAEEKLAALAGAFDALVRENPYYPQIMARELSAGGQNLSKRVFERQAALLKVEGEILSEGVREGRLRQVSPVTLHILLVVGTVMHQMAGRLRERAAKAGFKGLPALPAWPAGTVADLVLHGLKVQPAGEKGAAGPGALPLKENPIRPAALPRRHKENSR
jgi:AcrR family transcriptional regulator